MSININVISHSSNKSLEFVNSISETIKTNTTNEIINIPYDTSYIVYIKPEIQDTTFSGFLNISNSVLSGLFGYIWIIILMLLFFILIKGVKSYVK